MIFFIVSAAVVLVLSVLCRRLALLYLADGTVKKLIPGFLEFVYVKNTGAAFGMMSGKTVFLSVVTGVIIAAIIFYVLAKRNDIPPLEKFSLSLITAGGLCNLYERIFFGFVTDYIDTHILPVFNVADIAVTCGCILLIYTVFFPPKEKTDEQ